MLAKMSFLWNDKTTCQKSDVSKSRSTKVVDDNEKPKNVDVETSKPKDVDNVDTSKSKEDILKEKTKTSTSNVDRVSNDSISNDKTTEKDQELTESKTELKEDTKSSPTKDNESDKFVETKKIEKSCGDGEKTNTSKSEKSKVDQNVDKKSPAEEKKSKTSTSTTKNVEAVKKSTKEDDKKSTKKIPTDENLKNGKTSSNKNASESGSTYKRKLEEEKSATETDSSKDGHEESSVTKPKPFSKVKKIKRSHTSEAVSKFKTANAISSSLSSSLLEKEEQSRVGKRKLRSPEQGINERKFPKKEAEKLQQLPKNESEDVDSGEESDEDKTVNKETQETQLSSDDSFQLSGHADEVDFSRVTEKSNIVETFIDNSFLDETGTTVLNASETEESPYAKIPIIEEVDRRHEIADVEALERDRERDRARAEKLLSAFDDSD